MKNEGLYCAACNRHCDLWKCFFVMAKRCTPRNYYDILPSGKKWNTYGKCLCVCGSSGCVYHLFSVKSAPSYKVRLMLMMCWHFFHSRFLLIVISAYLMLYNSRSDIYHLDEDERNVLLPLTNCSTYIFLHFIFDQLRLDSVFIEYLRIHFVCNEVAVRSERDKETRKSFLLVSSINSTQYGVSSPTFLYALLSHSQTNVQK